MRQGHESGPAGFALRPDEGDQFESHLALVAGRLNELGRQERKGLNVAQAADPREQVRGREGEFRGGRDPQILLGGSISSLINPLPTLSDPLGSIATDLLGTEAMVRGVSSKNVRSAVLAPSE